MSRLRDIEEQAAVWLAREDRGFGEAEREAFAAWLEQSTANTVAYLRLKAAWQRMDRLAAFKHPEPMRPKAVPVWNAMGGISALAATVLLTLGIGAGVYYLDDGGRAPAPAPVYATEVGRQQTVRLADGTSVELNTNTRLKADMTTTARVVKLESGEAYFDVARDASRPFVVYAGDRKITDIGTKFSVHRSGNKVEVLVAEGRVRVDMPTTRTGSRAIEASASSIIVAEADGTLVARKSETDIADRLSWRQGMLVFNHDTLAEVAAEFNRYNNRHVVVMGPARDLRIGGRFRSDNVEVFVALLKEGFGLKIKRTDSEIVVSE